MTLLLLRGRRRVAAVLAIAAVAAMAVTTAQSSAQTPEPWPSFTMIWRETGTGLGPNGATGTQLFRLEYTGRRQFRTTLLENPAVPDAVGSTWTFDGRTSTFHDARHGTDVVQPFKPEELTVPDDWLVPGRIAFLSKQPGYISTPIGNDLAALRHEETLPNGKSVREEVTYRLADSIPTRRVISVNGAEISRKEAIEFRLGTP